MVKIIILLVNFTLTIGLVVLNLYCSNGEDYDPNIGRLPDELVPLHYELNIDPNIKESFYNGTVSITMRRTKEFRTKRLLLHADARMGISKVQFYNKPVGTPLSQEGSTLVQDLKISRDFKLNLLVIEFEEEIEINTLPRLFISFSHWLRTDGSGLLRYEDKFLHTEFLLARISHGNARHLFPCFDEPKFRANFRLALRVPPDYYAKSNEFAIGSYFDQTDHESRFVEFKLVEDIAPDELAIFMGKMPHAKIMADNEKRIVMTRASPNEFFLSNLHDNILRASYIIGDMFRTRDFFNRLQLIVVRDVPKDLLINTPGLIIINEVDYTNISARAEMMATIMKGLARHILRRYATFEWPEDVWLFEGLVEWYVFHLIEGVNKDFRYRANFSIIKMRQVFEHYINKNSIQIYDPRLGPQIPNFRSPEYDMMKLKSLSIVRMIESYCGYEKFRDVIASIRNMPRLEVNGKKIGHNIGLSCEFNYENYIEKWLEKPGIPLIKAEIVDDRTVSLTQIVLSINKYGLNEGTESGWPMFIDYNLEGQLSPGQALFMDGSSNRGEIKFHKALSEQAYGWFLKFNIYGKGFYHVIYSDSLIDRFIHIFQTSMVSFSDRISLIDDQVTAFKTGHSSAYLLLKLMTMIDILVHPITIPSLVRAYTEVSKAFRGTEYEEELARFARNRFGNLSTLNNFKTDSDDPNFRIERRRLVSEMLVKAGHGNMLRLSILTLEQFKAQPKSAEKSHKLALYIAGVKRGHDSDLLTFKQIFETDPEARIYIARALAWFEKPDVLNFAISLIGLDFKCLYEFYIESLNTSQGRNMLKYEVMREDNLLQIIDHLGLERGSRLVMEYCVVMWNHDKKLCANIQAQLEPRFGSQVAGEIAEISRGLYEQNLGRITSDIDKFNQLLKKFVTTNY